MKGVSLRRPSPQSLPDDMLLAGLGAGDPQMALAFVRRFQRTAFGVALAIVGDGVLPGFMTLSEDRYGPG
jgi:hypothetical protein